VPERSVPSGMVAFLFSDIEGSTALLRRVGGDYRHHLGQYRVLLLDVFEQHNGSPLGSEGDSLFVAFRQVSSALAAAVAGQLALTTHQWPQDIPVRARIGVHVGEAERLGDRYVGMAIHVAVRARDARPEPCPRPGTRAPSATGGIPVQ
jgi:class 3 adenylate cyclase